MQLPKIGFEVTADLASCDKFYDQRLVLLSSSEQSGLFIVCSNDKTKTTPTSALEKVLQAFLKFSFAILLKLLTGTHRSHLKTTSVSTQPRICRTHTCIRSHTHAQLCTSTDMFVAILPRRDFIDGREPPPPATPCLRVRRADAGLGGTATSTV